MRINHKLKQEVTLDVYFTIKDKITEVVELYPSLSNHDALRLAIHLISISLHA